MDACPGKLLTLDLMLTVWRIPVQVSGQVEIMDFKRPVAAEESPAVRVGDRDIEARR